MRKLALARFLMIGVIVMILGACATMAPVPAPVAMAPTMVAPTSPAPVATPAPAPVMTTSVVKKKITYEILGVKSRAEKAGLYMNQNGFSVVIKPTEKEAMGEIEGKPWPGVNVVRKGAAKGEGIWIWVPVSDAALKKGLCSDQQSLLDNLPKWEEKVVQQQVPQSAPAAAVATHICKNKPFERRGFWAGVPIGNTCVEVKMKEGYYEVVLTEVKDFKCFPKGCYSWHQLPSAGELSDKWGGNWTLIRHWPAGDGGQHATIQLWQRQ